ncbi:MAG: F0F1 ATP synthase subunit A [Lachnospiraceae bacterium]|nr:F0F1 ATP synthase subunit A [Lachnospiraceae bacterium]
MGSLADELLKELEVETVFSFDVGGYHINIFESTVITWCIMAFLLVFCIVLTSGMKVRGQLSRRQIIAETIVTKLDGFVGDMVGEEGHAYVPYLCSVLIYLALANTIGVFGLKPPTKDLNSTIALALMSIILIQVANIRAKKVKGWIKSFAEPIAIVTPINILELVIKPLSLCMRLFGNVLGAFVIMELVKIAMKVPVVVPVVLGAYFDIFDGLIQAYIFVFLTSLFIREVVE